MTQHIRRILAALISPIMALTGFRFSKAYRHGVTRYHRLVYATVFTVMANYDADAICHWLTKK